MRPLILTQYGTHPPLVHTLLALLLLLAAIALAIYKPRGLTRYGHRKQSNARRKPALHPEANLQR